MTGPIMVITDYSHTWSDR